MSVESFLNQPLDQGLLRKAKETGRSVSLPRVLGDMIMVEGTAELRRLATVNGGSVLTIGSANFSKSVGSEAAMNFGGIILGATIAVIEEAMVVKQIDLQSFTSQINHALSGTPPAILSSPAKPIQQNRLPSAKQAYRAGKEGNALTRDSALRAESASGAARCEACQMRKKSIQSP